MEYYEVNDLQMSVSCENSVGRWESSNGDIPNLEGRIRLG